MVASGARRVEEAARGPSRRDYQLKGLEQGFRIGFKHMIAHVEVGVEEQAA